jgi:hypothetical protein
MSDIIENLMRLGMSEYEDKAYIATVVLGEGTIKEISDESKVPRSRAYDIMERLLDKGFVEVGNTNPRCYRAKTRRSVRPSDRGHGEGQGWRGKGARGSSGALRKGGPIPSWTILGEWAIDPQGDGDDGFRQAGVVIISIHNDYTKEVR